MKKNIITAVLTAMLSAATVTSFSQVGFETNYKIVETTDDFGDKTGKSMLLILAKGKFSNSVVTKETAYLGIGMDEQNATYSAYSVHSVYSTSKYSLEDICKDEMTIKLKGKTDGNTYTCSTMMLQAQQLDDLFFKKRHGGRICELC